LEINILELGKWISKKDALAMLEIVHASLFCRTEKDFLKLMEQFRELVFFEHSISGWSEINNVLQNEKISSYNINDGYPDEYLNIYLTQGLHLKDIALLEFYKTFELQNFVDLDPLYKEIPDNPVLDLCHDFGLNDGFVYGVCDRDCNSATAIFLTGHQAENNQRTRAIIKYLIPHLSVAIKRLIPSKTDGQIPPLTPKELEVLKWLKEGKSSWEVSMILNRSERVVEFHINNILKKLNAMNRTHAVAIALENHLIPI
jgi:DNA-binding CsgD family transcriptional regulator